MVHCLAILVIALGIEFTANVPDSLKSVTASKNQLNSCCGGVMRIVSLLLKEEYWELHFLNLSPSTKTYRTFIAITVPYTDRLGLLNVLLETLCDDPLGSPFQLTNITVINTHKGSDYFVRRMS